MEAKKVDLLSFQKNLNEQFIEIFEAKKEGRLQSAQSMELGLQAEVANFKFFISLKDLQNISMNNNYEESKLLSSWICGFNQIRGEVFTIMDFRKTIEYLLDKKDDKNYKKLGLDNRIIYLKEYNEEKIGLIIDNINLIYTPELTLLFKQEAKDNKKTWQLNADLDFESFVKEDNMSKEEFDVVKGFLNKEIIKSYSEESLKNILFYLVNDIYLDISGKRPVFVLDVENLTKVLIDISPLQ